MASNLGLIVVLGVVAVGGFFAYQKGCFKDPNICVNWVKSGLGGGGSTPAPTDNALGGTVPTNTKDCIYNSSLCQGSSNKSECINWVNTINSKCCNQKVLGDQTGKAIAKCLNSVPNISTSKMAHAYRGKNIRLTLA